MTCALAISKQVFGAAVGNLTKVFGSYANSLTSFLHRCRGLNTVFGSYTNYLTSFLAPLPRIYFLVFSVWIDILAKVKFSNLRTNIFYFFFILFEDTSFLFSFLFVSYL